MSEFSYRYFWVKKTGEFLTVLVPAMFILLYLVPVSSLLSGKDSFDFVMQMRDVMPLHAFKEVLFFIFFAGYTVMAIVLAYSVLSATGWFSNLSGITYFLRGICSLISIPFIGHFFFAMRLPYIFTPASLEFSTFAGAYGHGAMKYFFCAGAMATAFTLFSSISYFLFESGVLVSKRSRTAGSVLAWCAFLVSALWCLRVSIAF